MKLYKDGDISSQAGTPQSVRGASDISPVGEWVMESSLMKGKERFIYLARKKGSLFNQTVPYLLAAQVMTDLSLFM